MRIDRLLFTLRFAKSRTLAQRWIAEGHIRRNGVRVVRQDLEVAIGDVLTLPLRSRVLVIELPARRGPPAEARVCYRALDAGLDGRGANGIAGGEALDGFGADNGPVEGEAPQ
jgi:ribosome-associated heat shock protein Hsp15